MKPTMSVVTKCLISAMILAIAVQAQDVLPRVNDSPPFPLPPPPPNSLNCDEKCSTQCAERRIFSMMICYGVCIAKCTILPFDHTTSLHNHNKKHIDGVVNPCHKNKCT